jgi:hypothetical protein
MDYETLELKETGTIVPDDKNDDGTMCATVSSSYEYIEGAGDSPYIITSSSD